MEMKQRLVQVFTQDTQVHASQNQTLKDVFMVDTSNSIDWDAITDNVHFVPPSPEVIQLDELLARYMFLFSDPDLVDTISLDVPLEWCTPQVKKLVELLVEHHTQSFQGIVFVEQRHVATALARLLPRIPVLQGKIKSAELVGHGASAAAKALVKGMGVQNQQDVVKSFRDGELNLRKWRTSCYCPPACSDLIIMIILVVATSVAEEGLDFPVRLSEKKPLILTNTISGL
jgi:endoribonuclease Dicer